MNKPKPFHEMQVWYGKYGDIVLPLTLTFERTMIDKRMLTILNGFWSGINYRFELEPMEE